MIYPKNMDKLTYHLFCLILVFLLCTGTTRLSLFLYRLGIDVENLLMLYFISVVFTTLLTRGYFYEIIIAFLNFIHDGKLSLHSILDLPDHGTVFTITLPLPIQEV